MADHQERDQSSAQIWGTAGKEDYLPVPRTLLYLHRFRSLGETELKPQHAMLLLNLMARKFGRKPIRAYWDELARDLGVTKDTVRKWAYHLRDKGLLGIKQNRRRNPEEDHRVGARNDRNELGAISLDAEWPSTERVTNQ